MEVAMEPKTPVQLSPATAAIYDIISTNQSPPLTFRALSVLSGKGMGTVTYHVKQLRRLELLKPADGTPGIKMIGYRSLTELIEYVNELKIELWAKDALIKELENDVSQLERRLSQADTDTAEAWIAYGEATE